MSERRGNVAAETYYDPFPKEGLVKQYEPYIRKCVGEFCKQYPRLHRDDVLSEAVRLACRAEKRFKPGLGNDFSTFLGGRKGRPGYLKGLYRFAEREAKLQRISVDVLDGGYQKAQEAQEAEEAKTPDGKFYPGPNGPTFSLDFQWMDCSTYPLEWEPDIRIYYGGNLVRRYAEKPMRAVVRVRLANAAVMLPASPDIRLVVPVKTDLRGEPADVDKRQAYARAVFDHHYRRQAEMDEEAENQERGDYNPVFLEAKPITGGIDITERKGREPPRFQPDWIPMCSLGDAYSYDDGWKGNLSDTIATGPQGQSENDSLIEVIKEERPFMSEVETAVADWMIALLSGLDDRKLVQFAAERGISKGYVSKLRERIAKKVKARLSGSPKQNNFGS